MKKRWYVTLAIWFLFYLSGCSDKLSENAFTSIDTIGAVSFTDKKMEEKGFDIVERCVSQRTDSIDLFIIEYWWQEETKTGHYGYYIQQGNDNSYIVLEEGENVNKDIFVTYHPISTAE